ncbi:TPA: ribonuclease HII, partial [Neisseria gonorrhoeae]
ATMLAMKRAVYGLAARPEKIFIDGNRIPEHLGIPAEAVVKGDSKIIEISAASVLAKTARDAEMYALAQRRPQYGFDKHKGYGTKQHLEALKQYGVLPEHRRDFAPVRNLLAQQALF